MVRNPPDTGSPPVRLVACRVFAPALERLGISVWPGVEVRFLPSRLHLFPPLLRQHLDEELTDARSLGVAVVALYGDCFPEIDRFCAERGALKVSGAHCYEILLGAERYQGLMERSAGTFFAERELLSDFESLCLEPLELDDPEMRTAYFAHYRHLVYLRQPGDPELESKAAEVAAFLGLAWDIAEADYRHLEARLCGALNRARAGGES